MDHPSAYGGGIVAVDEVGISAIDPDMKRISLNRVNGIISSLLVEDCQNFAKNAAAVKGKRRYRRPEKCMGAVLIRKAVSTTHKYITPDCNAALPSKCLQLPEAAFVPDRKKSTCKFADVASTSSVTPWHSPGAPEHCQNVADLVMIRLAAALNDFTIMDTAWLGRLFKQEHHIVFREKAGPISWHFGLHHWTDSAVVAWPAYEVITFCGDAKIYVLPDLKVREPTYLTTYALEAYEGYTYTFRSVLWQMNRLGPHLGGVKPAIRAFVNQSAPTNIESLAALHAFWDIEQSYLVKLAGYLRLKLEFGGKSLFELVYSMIRAILKCDEEEALDLCVQRAFKVPKNEEIADELTGLDEAVEVLDKKDRTVVDTCKDDFVREAEKIGEFKSGYKALRRKVNQAKSDAIAAAAGPKAKGKGQGGASTATLITTVFVHNGPERSQKTHASALRDLACEPGKCLAESPYISVGQRRLRLL
jgi:hypothetical protein